MLREVTATRYVTPLREGGSLPGVVEADDLGTYVVKFRGAGQGPKALVAEVISGELARRLGLPVPELVVTRPGPGRRPGPSRTRRSRSCSRPARGANLGMDFLPGALGYDPVAHPVDAALASRVCGFDAFVENVDRSWRNPNLLIWHGGALADRPRRDAVLPPQLAARRQPWCTGRTSADDHVLKPYATRAGRRPARSWPPSSPRRCWPRSSRWCRTSGCDDAPGRRAPRTSSI